MNILLIDDHTLFSRSLSIALSDFPEIERFTATKDLHNLPQVLETEQPDLLLVDINLGNLSNEDGLQLTKYILERFPDQKILILSGYDLPVYRKEAKKIGARGFVSKDVEPEELLHILTAVSNGSLCFPRESTIPEDLTESEKQILSLVAAGIKRKEIADRLFLSERTVSNHLQHIFEKLQVTSAVEAVTKAIRCGYIPPLC